MTDINNLIQFLKEHDYTAFEYYSLDGYCFLVKVIHNTGSFFSVTVSKKYRISIPSEFKNHYILEKDDLINREISSKNLNECYPNIELNTTASDNVGNMNDKLVGNYKQPITIISNRSYQSIEQINRLKHCFKLLEYKLFIQDQFSIVLLTKDNTVVIYKVENYPKTKNKIYFINITLEQLYSKITIIHNVIDQVEDEFRDILDVNQTKHNQYLNTNYVEHFINNNDKILKSKQIMVGTKKDISVMLLDICNTEDKLLKERQNISYKSSHNVFHDAEISAQKEIIDQKISKLHELKLNLLDKVITINLKIRDIYLIVDQLGFNLSLSLNDLRSELSSMLSTDN